ncbi:MAG TPA: ATP-binding protein [bacterium]|jgi:serine/threonine-protein kinase RsbT|nr:ATP-binding protein [bacterium]
MQLANSYDLTLPVKGRCFITAGQAASKIKRTLETFNLPPKLVRCAAICAYEAEMNIVTHARQGQMGLRVTADAITIVAQDQGPGIPDVDQAMTEGYSTASQEIREMGFGAGMGLPNIKRCADELIIDSCPSQGTRVEITIRLSANEG